MESTTQCITAIELNAMTQQVSANVQDDLMTEHELSVPRVLAESPVNESFPLTEPLAGPLEPVTAPQVIEKAMPPVVLIEKAIAPKSRRKTQDLAKESTKKSKDSQKEKGAWMQKDSVKKLVNQVKK